jgi:uncharacterized protein YbjT (DUF2867 family)
MSAAETRKTILVTGATGGVGGTLVDALLGRSVAIRAASRDPSRVPRVDGIDAVRFDLEDPGTFNAAFAGVDAVFLIARPGDDDPQLLAEPAIAAMRAAGVRHVVNLTAMGVERLEESGLRKVERLAEASGMSWTHLRPNFFMQIFATPPLVHGIRSADEIRLPTADARLSFIDVVDIADVAAAALLEPGHEGMAYTLTGGAALDHHEVAAGISRAAGRPVRYIPIEEDAAREQLRGAGFPEPRVERLIGFYRLVRAGACAPVSDDVATILRRPARTFADFAMRNANAWKR